MIRQVLPFMSVVLVACGPLGPLPGGQLEGEASVSPPGDWSFSFEYNVIQLEVRSPDPYSVDVWCVATGGSLYVGAGRGESSVWARALIQDPRARVRLGTVLYEVIATRVTAALEIEAYIEALGEKYGSSDAQLSDFQAGSHEPPSAVLFRLDPSPRNGAGQQGVATDEPQHHPIDVW
jgi:hypothetical protein